MDELFEEIKTYLDITWDMTAAEEKKLRGSIKRGMSYLKGKIGRCNFDGDTQEKALLMDYCMYERAGQLPEFVNNYKPEIISLQMNRWRENDENQG